MKIKHGVVRFELLSNVVPSIKVSQKISCMLKNGVSLLCMNFKSRNEILRTSYIEKTTEEIIIPLCECCHK